MSNSKWAHAYLIDPLNAPEPSQETGPGTHFGSTMAGTSYATSAQRPSSSSTMMTPPGSAKLPGNSPSNNPFRNSISETSKTGSTTLHSRSPSDPRNSHLPSPPNSAGHSPSNSRNPFEPGNGNSVGKARQRQSLDLGPPPPSYYSNSNRDVSSTRPRGHSLGTQPRPHELQTAKPLDIIRRESKRANRAPHLRRRHMPGPDVVDRLDSSVPGGAAYHHEGPFDATLLARNTSFVSSPVAAAAGTNAEALRATPRENVVDAVERHRPLEGVAFIPPGQQDRFGRTYDYEEGENMMIDLGGNYKRYPGLEYAKDDLKGKGEPQFSIDKARKEAKLRQRAGAASSAAEASNGDIEMLDTVAARPNKGEEEQPASSPSFPPSASASRRFDQGASSATETSRGEFLGRRPKSMKESGSSSGGPGGEKKSSLGGLKRRIGSLRKRLD